MFVRVARLPHLAVAACLLLSFGSGLHAQDKNAEYAAEMQKAEAAMSKRQYDDALKAFKKASSLKNKTSVEAHLGMARAHHGMGAFNKAVDSCEDAARHVASSDAETRARVHNQRGLSLFAASRKPNDKYIREAETAFRAALETYADLVTARYNLGVTLLRQEKDSEGIAELKMFVERAGDAAEAPEAIRFIDDPRRARENFAPPFSITTLDEQKLALDDLKGKVVLLDFWATWCPPCVRATPGLTRLYKKYQDRPFVIVGISLDEDLSPLRKYVKDHTMEWPQYLDRKGAIAKLFGVRPIPTYVLIDHEGIVRETREGWNPSMDGWLDSAVQKYLKAIPQ